MATIQIDNTTGPIQVGCLNSCSAVIGVRGTFTGEIVVDGAGFDGAPLGGRLLFKSGIGSIGSNIIPGYGDGREVEYRVVTGGGHLTFTPQNWVSGTAELTILQSEQPSVLFVNGPVHNSEEESLRNKRAYLASTGVLAVQATEALYVTLANPAGSGRKMFLTNRIFSNSATIPLEYQAYGNPTAVLAETGVSANRFVGEDSVIGELKYQVATGGTITMGGTPGSGETIPANGIPRERRVTAILAPGLSAGFEITGAGNNIGQAARLAVTFEWFEEELF